MESIDLNIITSNPQEFGKTFPEQNRSCGDVRLYQPLKGYT